jgi:hypothetical protein
MVGHLTSTDWDMIREFAETPLHERDPEMLVPEGSDGEP